MYIDSFSVQPEIVPPPPTPAKAPVLRETKPADAPKPPAPAPRPSPVVLGKDTTEPVRGIRKAMVQAMTAALSIPHMGFSDEMNLTELVQLKNELKTVSEARGVKFSYMPVFIKVHSINIFLFMSTLFRVLSCYFMPMVSSFLFYCCVVGCLSCPYTVSNY